MLLAGDVPELEAHRGAVHRDGLQSKVHPDGRAVVLRERVMNISTDAHEHRMSAPATFDE